MNDIDVLFITGVSGAGKTFLSNILKRKLLSYKVNIIDFDDPLGVPRKVHYWRFYQYKALEKVLIRNKEKDIFSIVCGLVFPKEINYKTLKTKYIYLDVSDEDIRERLLKPERGKEFRNLIEYNIDLKKLLKSEVEEINGSIYSSSDPDSYFECIKFIEKSLDCFRLYINQKEYESKAIEFLQEESGIKKHWETYKKRWSYHEKAIEVVKSLNIKNEKQVLEIGTAGINIVKNSDVLDYDGYWNSEKIKKTYNYDIRNVPFTFLKKHYKLIVALRVFHHLENWKDVLKETFKHTENLLIVVPENTNINKQEIERIINPVYYERINETENWIYLFQQ